MIEWYDRIIWNNMLIIQGLTYIHPELVAKWPKEHCHVKNRIQLYYDDWLPFTPDMVREIFHYITIQNRQYTEHIIDEICYHIEKQKIYVRDSYDMSKQISNYASPTRLENLIRLMSTDEKTNDVILCGILTSAIRYYRNTRDIICSIFQVGYEPMIQWIMEESQFEDFWNMYHMWNMSAFQRYIRENYRSLVLMNWYGLEYYRDRLISNVGFMSRELFDTIAEPQIRSVKVLELILLKNDIQYFEWEPTQHTWDHLIRQGIQTGQLMSIYRKWGPFDLNYESMVEYSLNAMLPMNYRVYFTERLEWYSQIGKDAVMRLLANHPNLHRYIYKDELAGVSLLKMKVYHTDIISRAKVFYLLQTIQNAEELFHMMEKYNHVDGYSVLRKYGVRWEMSSGRYYPLIAMLR